MSALLNTRSASRRGRSTIRTRVLAIAFVPSIVFLIVGASLAGYLIYDAVQLRSFATKVHNAAEPAGRFFATLREERRLTLQELADERSLRPELRQVRAATDQTAQEQRRVLDGILNAAPGEVKASVEEISKAAAALPEFRQRVDRGEISLQQAYEFYNKIIDRYAAGLNSVAQETPTAETAYKRLMAMPLFTASEAMSRGDALASAGIAGGGLSEEEYRSYIGQIGAYHSALRQARPEMSPPVRQAYKELVNSPAWNTLRTVENAFLRGNQDNLPVPEAEWRSAAEGVSKGLWDLYVRQSTEATNLAVDEAEDTLITSIIAAAAVLLLACLAFFVAWRMSTRLINRLTTLRAETLEIAGEHMPRLVDRVRRGDQVDLSHEVSYLEHGTDEIGQVADAFNKAQQTAIGAAVDEAKTREGTKRVFLNIAHRSQLIVHRQLQALDEAERKQEDPDQLDMLFRLDHLSTRARRNAENLIILGGEQPGRQFRSPVAIGDIVRGAMAETEDYKRVTMSRLPATAVAGPVVGDLVHLLAELIDNATSFSPPQSRVEVRGELVGRGAVIEVEDQGIGMEAEELGRINDMLIDPPNFSFMALSDEPRLGLFVVARLAAKHGLTVTMRESAYGGTRAIVLVRGELLSEVTEKGPIPATAEADTGEQSSPPLSRRPRPVPKAQVGRVNGSHDAPEAPTGPARSGRPDAGGTEIAAPGADETTTVSPTADGSGSGITDGTTGPDGALDGNGASTDNAITGVGVGGHVPAEADFRPGAGRGDTGRRGDHDDRDAADRHEDHLGERESHPAANGGAGVHADEADAVEPTVTMHPPAAAPSGPVRDTASDPSRTRPELPRRSGGGTEPRESRSPGSAQETTAQPSREAQVRRDPQEHRSGQVDTPSAGEWPQQTGHEPPAGAQPPVRRRRADGGGQHAAPPQGRTGAGQDQPSRAPQAGQQPGRQQADRPDAPPRYAPRLPQDHRESPGQAQHGARHRQDTRTTAAPSAQADATVDNPMAPGRPELPRRRKQQNLAPQLREESESAGQHRDGDGDENAETPDQARSRLTAFQHGTRRARHQQPGDETGD